MWRPGPIWDDEDALTRRFRSATPFRHLVLDDFVDPIELDALLATVDDEPIEEHEADIFRFEASRPEPRTEALRALRDGFAKTYAAPLSRISGRDVQRCDMRAYAYRAGHYLLPHSDHQGGVGRVLAYAFYLPTPEPPIGGELELFSWSVENDDLGAPISARIIEPRANRIVVFEVGEASLHQVREVLSGLRISLAGWFYP